MFINMYCMSNVIAPTATIQAAASKIVRDAEFMGGSERIAQIATFGHKGEFGMASLGLLESDRFELLNAVQDQAKAIEATR